MWRYVFSLHCRGKREPRWTAAPFHFCCQTSCCGWILKGEPAGSPSAVSLPNTFLFMLITTRLLFFLFALSLLHPLSAPNSSSAHSLCLSHSRCGHRRHVLGVALHVPGGVADGARSSGGVAGELRDLLQGQGDRLQGDSVEAGRRRGRGLPSSLFIDERHNETP